MAERGRQVVNSVANARAKGVVRMKKAANSMKSAVKRIRRSRPRDQIEAEALAAFRKELTSKKCLPLSPRMIICGDEDATLLRFLRARKLDVAKAVHMIEDTIEWRKANNVDTILEHPLDPRLTAMCRKAHVNTYNGYDNAGRPLYIEKTGLIDIDGVLEVGVDFLVKLHIFNMECVVLMFLSSSIFKQQIINYFTMDNFCLRVGT